MTESMIEDVAREARETVWLVSGLVTVKVEGPGVSSPWMRCWDVGSGIFSVGVTDVDGQVKCMSMELLSR